MTRRERRGAERLVVELEPPDGLFDGGDRGAEHADRRAEVEAELGGEVSVERVGGDDVDGARHVVDADGERGEPAAHGAREASDEIGRPHDLAQAKAADALELVFEGARAQRPAIEEDPREGYSAHAREKQRGLDLFRRHDTCRDEAPSQVDRHARQDTRTPPSAACSLLVCQKVANVGQRGRCLVPP